MMLQLPRAGSKSATANPAIEAGERAGIRGASSALARAASSALAILVTNLVPSVALADIAPDPVRGGALGRVLPLVALLCAVQALVCWALLRPPVGARRGLLVVIPATVLTLLVLGALQSMVGSLHLDTDGKRGVAIVLALVLAVTLEAPLFFLAFARTTTLRRAALVAAVATLAAAGAALLYAVT